jgi:hypothetical protein
MDVGILCHSDGLGCGNAGSAIQGGKRFIELDHVTTDRRFSFHQINLMACLGNVQSCLNSGNAGPSHQ